LLDYFAGLLRGTPPDLDGPPLELYPRPAQLRHALEHRGDALDAVQSLYDSLPGSLRETLPAPQDLLEVDR
jgi:hypothetical protein